MLVVGYKRPDEYSQGRPGLRCHQRQSSRAAAPACSIQDLVRDKQIALEAEADDTFPAGKYPNLFLFFLAPAAGHTTAENEKALYDVLEKFKSKKVDAATLARVKTKTRAGLIRRLDSNSGLASLVTDYHAIYGDWRKLFTSLDELDRVTADDVQRVAKEYFVPEKRTVVLSDRAEACRRRRAMKIRAAKLSLAVAAFAVQLCAQDGHRSRADPQHSAGVPET